MFLEAIDPDNIDSDPDDDGTYEDVFYNIVGKLIPLLVLCFTDVV